MSYTTQQGPQRGDWVRVTDDAFFNGPDARKLFHKSIGNKVATVEHVRTGEDGTTWVHLFWYDPGVPDGFRRPWATTLPTAALSPVYTAKKA